MRRGVVTALVGVAAFLAAAPAAPASHSVLDQVGIGPGTGNGAFASVFRGTTADGGRAYIQTAEPLVAADTDAAIDIYERAGTTTTQVSTGPAGGNGTPGSFFMAVSQDGTRVFFRTTESLVTGDTDTREDLYMRSGGTTTRVSAGAINGNGNFVVIFKAISKDGTSAFFETMEQLVSGDTDAFRDVYRWSGGTTTLISTGSAGGNGSQDAYFAGITPDGSTAFFHTDESVEITDTDLYQDVYRRTGSTTTHLSIGPAGGNGNDDFDYDAVFEGTSDDASKVWLSTDEVLVSGDTDEAFDVYERAGASISVISTGPAGGNGAQGAFFDAASPDGSRVIFDTQESLVAGDTDAQYDIYQRSGGTTTHISTGPDGGNGAVFSAFWGMSADGSRVFFTTPDMLVAADADGGWQDVYERSGSTTTLISTGTVTNGAFPADFRGVSADGSRVVFSTDEPLEAGDTDIYPDVFERAGGSTTRLTTGPAGGNGEFFPFFAGMAEDASRIFFETPEVLLASDTDASADVYRSSIAVNSFARPKGATPMRVPLVPAHAACTAPNRTHGPALNSPSCNPAVPASAHLTVGVPTGEGGPGGAANAIGAVRLDVQAGNAGTPADEADLLINQSFADVRCRTPVTTTCGAANGSGYPDYTGQLAAVFTLRLTDRFNGSLSTDPATVADIEFSIPMACTSTASTAAGSDCAVSTTADTLVPGMAPEGKRSIWDIGQVRLFDGGADGLAATAPNTVYAVQGLFTP